MSWPSKHRALVQELLREYDFDEDKLRNALVRLGLDAVAGARTVDLPRVEAADDDADEIPSVEEVVASAGEPVGLGVREFIPGRPSSAVLYATNGQVVVGGDDEDTQVIVTESGVRTVVRSLTARGRSAGAVFSVSLRELRMRDRFAPDGHALLVFVLRSECRAWIMTRGEVFAVVDALERGRKLDRFSLSADGSLRVSMPKKPTGLDLAFPRVAPWSEGA